MERTIHLKLVALYRILIDFLIVLMYDARLRLSTKENLISDLTGILVILDSLYDNVAISNVLNLLTYLCGLHVMHYCITQYSNLAR